MLRTVKRFLFEHRTVRQTIAKNTFWLTVSNVGGRFIRAIIIIYAARVLGAEDWGVFSYAISLVTFLTVFTDLGISPILTRETAKSPDPLYRAKILSTSFILKLALLAAGILVVLLVAPRSTNIHEVVTILPIATLVLIFDTLREFGFAVTRALEKMEWEAGLYLLTNLAIVVFGALALWLSPSVASFTAAYAVGTGIGMAATFYALRDRFSNLFANFSRRLVKPILSSGMPFAVSAVLGMLLLNTDIIIIGYFSSAEQVGYYSAAQRIIQLFYLLPSILAVSAFPTFARLAMRDNERFRNAFERLTALVFSAAIPLAIGGFILGRPVIALVFGNAYLPAASSFQILMLTVLVNFPAVLLSNALFAFNRQRVLVNFAAIGGISNIILDLLFIPAFGIVGSAWSTLIGQAMSNAYLWKKLKGVVHFSIMPRLARIFIASAAMTAITLFFYATGLPVIPTILVSIAAYAGILYALKEPLIKEISLILKSSV